ncbi:MAG: universal stress protein [Pirellulaceae bacterium]
MDNPTKIVCAVDVNQFDQKQVDLAAMFANLENALLEIVHVTVFPEFEGMELPGYRGSPAAIIDDGAKLQQVEPSIPVKRLTRIHLSGGPAKRLLKHVQDEPPILLVLGCRPHSAAGQLLGSVSAVVLRRAACPVLVWKSEAGTSEHNVQAI